MVAMWLALSLAGRIRVCFQRLVHAARAIQRGWRDACALITGPSEDAQAASEFSALADIRQHIEHALQDRDAPLRLVVHQLPMMLWTTDRDLKFTSCLGKGFQ